MKLRSTLLLAPLSLLGGCALIYQYGDYKEGGTTTGGAGTTASSSSSSTGTGGAATSSSSSSTGGGASSSSGTGGGASLGKPCVGGSECASGYCVPKLHGGGSVCCEQACSMCQVCDLSGAPCLDAPMGESGVGCPAPMVCDGSLMCTKSNAVACTLTSDCLSGYCEHADPPGTGNICCNISCSAPCQGCSPSTGNCTSVASMVPDSTCTTTTAPGFMGQGCGIGANQCVCNGMGFCKKKAGGTCTDPKDCLSGTCSATVCQ